MSTVGILGYMFSAVSILAAIYVALSRDLLRVIIAFFVEIACVSGVLLTLGADYLALVVFSVALVGSVLVISFSSVITGSLKQSFSSEDRSKRHGITAILGMLIGIGVGVALGWAFLSISGSIGQEVATRTKSSDAVLIGKMLLGEQLAVFEMLALVILLVAVGAGLLLRRPNDAA